MKIAVVNDALTQIPGTTTLWSSLVEWLQADFVGDVPFASLAEKAAAHKCDILVRNGSYFPPIKTQAQQISIVQDIFESGPQREMQEVVIKSSRRIVYNSPFTRSKYFGPDGENYDITGHCVIPLPVDFNLFEPGNAMGLQQAHSLPDGCVCWVGAQSEIKGYDIFLSIVRRNPDLPFVAVFKDAPPAYGPPNLRIFSRLPHKRLVEVIGACRVGLCTSRIESQHLAGIEMGACGLPMVAPPVGCYWKREDIPGVLVAEPSVQTFTTAIRAVLSNPGDPQQVRAYWEREFSEPVVKAAWTKLVKEVECSGQS